MEFDTKFHKNLPVIGCILFLSALFIPSTVQSQNSSVLTGKRRFGLSKCNENVTDKFLFIPKFLQIKYPEAKVQWFKSQLRYEKYLYNFSLRANGLSCGSSSNYNFSVDILRHEDLTTPTWFFFTPDGFLNYNREKTPETPEQEITYHPKSFCISKISETQITVQACKSRCGTLESERGDAMCIRKCCTFGQVKTESGCQDVSGPDWIPPIWENLYASESKPIRVYQFERADVLKNWNCTGDPVALAHQSQDFRILSNNKVFWKKPGQPYWKQLYPGSNPSKFCVDGFWNTTVSEVYNPNLTHFSLRCDLSQEEMEELQNPATDPELILQLSSYRFHNAVMFGILLVTSVIFLVLSIIYGLLWKQQNVNGWTVFAFTFTQFLYNSTRCFQSGWFAFGDPGSLRSDQLRPLCLSMGIVLQFSIIGLFAWTSVLTFDVWSKIRSIRAQSRTYKGQKRFAAYCVTGLTLPLIWVLVAIAMEFGARLEEHEDDDGLIRPGFQKNCEVDTSTLLPYLIYVGIPIIILFVLNMVLATSTVKFIWDSKKNVASLTDSKTANINHAKLAVKLFVMMGIFLVVEAVQTFRNLSLYSVYWVFVELYRIPHAIALAWIFVANERILSQVRSRFPSLKTRLPKTLTSSNVNGPPGTESTSGSKTG